MYLIQRGQPIRVGNVHRCQHTRKSSRQEGQAEEEDLRKRNKHILTFRVTPISRRTIIDSPKMVLAITLDWHTLLVHSKTFTCHQKNRAGVGKKGVDV